MISAKICFVNVLLFYLGMMHYYIVVIFLLLPVLWGRCLLGMGTSCEGMSSRQTVFNCIRTKCHKTNLMMVYCLKFETECAWSIDRSIIDCFMHRSEVSKRNDKNPVISTCVSVSSCVRQSFTAVAPLWAAGRKRCPICRHIRPSSARSERGRVPGTRVNQTQSETSSWNCALWTWRTWSPRRSSLRLMMWIRRWELSCHISSMFLLTIVWFSHLYISGVFGRGPLTFSGCFPPPPTTLLLSSPLLLRGEPPPAPGSIHRKDGSPSAEKVGLQVKHFWKDAEFIVIRCSYVLHFPPSALPCVPESLCLLGGWCQEGWGSASWCCGLDLHSSGTLPPGPVLKRLGQRCCSMEAEGSAWGEWDNVKSDPGERENSWTSAVYYKFKLILPHRTGDNLLFFFQIGDFHPSATKQRIPW